MLYQCLDLRSAPMHGAGAVHWGPHWTEPSAFHLWADAQQLSPTSPHLTAVQNGFVDSKFCLGILKKRLMF